ncbi:MAG: hypothetical protein ACK4TB_11320 [Gemmobacter sp.]
MPLPLVPIVLVGGAAAASWAALRALRPGRTDQRAEDALDDMGEGLALHAPADRPGQRNLALRAARRITVGARVWMVDAALLGRLRVERVE